MMAMWHFDEKSRVIFIDQTEIIEHTHELACSPQWKVFSFLLPIRDPNLLEAN